MTTRQKLWTAEEDAALYEGWRDRLGVCETIAKYGLNRSYDAAKVRLWKLRSGWNPAVRVRDPRLGPTDAGIASTDRQMRNAAEDANIRMVRALTRYYEKHAPNSLCAAQCRNVLRRAGVRA